MPASSSACISSILHHLGHKAPSDSQLDKAIREGLRDFKKNEGMDPDNVKVKLAVPIEASWIKDF